jgi:hypothetical protein
MLTLRQLYKQTPADEETPSPAKPIHDCGLSPEFVSFAGQTVAIMTESHLDCPRKKCRGERWCRAFDNPSSEAVCEAPITKQRLDMTAALYGFRSFMYLCSKVSAEKKRLARDEERKKREREAEGRNSRY